MANAHLLHRNRKVCFYILFLHRWTISSIMNLHCTTRHLCLCYSFTEAVLSQHAMAIYHPRSPLLFFIHQKTSLGSNSHLCFTVGRNSTPPSSTSTSIFRITFKEIYKIEEGLKENDDAHSSSHHQ